MKFLSSIILILFFYQIGNSQVEPRLINYQRHSTEGIAEGFWKAYEKDIAYDQNGNISNEIIKYAIDANAEIITQGGFYEYGANQNLKRYTSRRYNPDVDLWITKFWIDYEYDSNGCLLQTITTQNVGGNTSGRVTYVRNADCQILSEFTEWLGNGFDLTPKDSISRTYHTDGISYDEKYFKYSFIGDSLYLTRSSKLIFNEKEMLLEDHFTFFYQEQDTISDNQLFYDYDDFDNVTLMTSYKKDDNNEWQLNRKTHFYNEYDENNFLVYKRTEQFDHSIDPPFENLFYKREFNYINSCAGLQEEYTIHYENSGNQNRYEFIYEGFNKCFDIENETLEMSILPNPTSGEIKINSNIFQTGNTDILIYTVDGKILLQKKEIIQSEISTIDLSHLNNGIYILQLQNGKHLLNEKVVIAK